MDRTSKLHLHLFITKCLGKYQYRFSIWNKIYLKNAILWNVYLPEIAKLRNKLPKPDRHHIFRKGYPQGYLKMVKWKYFITVHKTSFYGGISNGKSNCSVMNKANLRINFSSLYAFCIIRFSLQPKKVGLKLAGAYNFWPIGWAQKWLKWTVFYANDIWRWKLVS